MTESLAKHNSKEKSDQCGTPTSLCILLKNLLFSALQKSFWLYTLPTSVMIQNFTDLWWFVKQKNPNDYKCLFLFKPLVLI